MDKNGNIINADTDDTTSTNSEKRKKEKKEDDLKFTDFLKAPRFYTCFSFFSLRNVHASLIGTSFQVFALHYETVSIKAQKIITTLSFFANFATTIFFSFFIDKCKYRYVNIPTYILVLIHSLTFQFIKTNSVLYVIYFFLVGMLQAIDNIAAMPHLYRVFGAKYVATIYGIFHVGTGLFNFLLSYLVNIILSGKPPGPDYDYSLNLLIYVSAMFTLTTIILMLLENEDPVLPKIKV